ncbi:SEFIR domain-containing protein [Nocardia sp. NRRL S-836]|uniref:SEFIR domain-containing protein n=1 Tax=Nocardia sp. NRRL S-836 TaxID=1519492 RepID=UPI0006AE4E2B|nr:SEFIR domain-containing protein [Nocardia sp. NRRL S-836]
MHPQVFVVWAHTSPGWDVARVQGWRDTVHRFAQLLHRLGVDADLDLFHQHEPVDWSTFCLQRMEDADRVVVAVSDGWKRAFRGDSRVSLGAEYELKHLRGMLMRQPDVFQRKVVVVVLPGAGIEDIPLSLHCVPHFVVDPAVPASARELGHLLRGQPMYVKPRAEPAIRRLARAGDPGVAAELLGTTVFLPDPGEPGLVTTAVEGYEKAVLVFTGLDRLTAYRRVKGLPWADRWLEVEGAELLPFVASAELAVVVDAGAAPEETVFLSSVDIGVLVR